jgi:glycosyltransferase involved in cell wall biosynthesis
MNTTAHDLRAAQQGGRDAAGADPRPLISLCLFCFNQKDYILESLNGAVNQTYRPLEIVISDDHSTDGTWEIITDFVECYTGSHRIILSRNASNLGIVGNWNACCSLAKGQLLVKADGDDISLPHRVERIAQMWQQLEPQPLLLSSSYRKIDRAGVTIGEYMLPLSGRDTRSLEDICSGRGFFHIGTASAYSRVLFDTFGPIQFPEAVDDASYEGRAVMLGTLACVPETLVLYRIGSGVTTRAGDYRATITRGIRLGLNARLQWLRDLEYLKDSIDPLAYERFKTVFSESLRRHQADFDLWAGATVFIRAHAFRRSFDARAPLKAQFIRALLLLPTALTKPVFCALRTLCK